MVTVGKRKKESAVKEGEAIYLSKEARGLINQTDRQIGTLPPEGHEHLYWRKGVVLADQEGTVKARVQADLEDACIDIRIRGKAASRRRFLQSIRDQLDAIHANIPRVQVTEQVPLPEHPGEYVSYKGYSFSKKRDGKQTM